MTDRRKKGRARERERLRRKRESERSILRALASFGDPLAAVHAIVSSPMGMHRYLTLASSVKLAIRAAVQQHPSVTAVGGMRELIEASAEQASELSWLEDAVPIDPRVPAVGIFRGRPYRLYPGMLERPLAALRRAELVSEAIDPVLRPLLGFGLADYVELCLEHSENALTALSPAWPDGPLPDVGDIPAISEAEVVAAHDVVLWSALGPTASDEHRKALDWATTSYNQLKVNVAQGMVGTCFGSALAVAGPGGSRLALPLPYIAEAWEYSVAALARRAAVASSGCEQNWLRVARAETGQMLAALRDLPPAHIAEGPAGPVMVIHFGRRHILLLAVAAGIERLDTQPAERALSAIVPGTSLRLNPGSLVIADDAQIVRVLVAAPVGPAMLAVSRDIALVTLEDLQRIASTCDRADALWGFFHEDVVSNKDIQMFGWETSNKWEFWKENGQALHRAGLAPTGIMIAPHQVGGPEWAEAAERAPLEWALTRLGLPQSKDLAAVEEGDGPIRILLPDFTMWTLALLERDDHRNGALFAERQEGEVPEGLWDFAYSLIGTASFVMLQVTELAAALLRACELDYVVVSYEYDADSTEPLMLESVGQKIQLRWHATIRELEFEQPGFIQEHIGQLLVSALSRLAGGSGETVRAFERAWQEAPRMIAVSKHDTPLQRARNLERPLSIPDWAVSQANRQLGKHVREVGHGPGRRDRADSRALELGVIVPWLRREVEQQFERFDRVAVMRRAASEIEAVASARYFERWNRMNRAQMPTAKANDDRAGLSADEEGKLARESAVLATLLELALAAGDVGNQAPDDIEWSMLLALAGLFVDSTLRCDALLHELSDDVTVVSDMFEITVEQEKSTIIDVDAFRKAQLRHARRDVEPHEQDVAGLTSADIFAIVDPAMFTDLGCTATTLIHTCAVLSAWPVTDEVPIADTTFEELCGRIESELGIAHTQALAAIGALSLTQEGLSAEQVQPWKGRSRDYRLLARPIVQLDLRTALVLPWNSETTGRVLNNYLFDGLLPWPTSRLDKTPNLRKALDQVRLSRTRVLEDQVEAELQHLRFVVRSRIKPQHARTIGLTSLPGEIDHLAVHVDGGVLWVVDDKDLSEVYTSAEMARGVRLFFDPKKGEIAKLQRKVDVIADNIEDVARALGVVHVPTSVRGLFVSRGPIPAAYAPSASVSFTTLRDLRHAVNAR